MVNDNMKDEILERVSDILIKRTGAVFAFFADHRESEGVFDVSFYSDKQLDEYEIRVIEDEIEKILGGATEINNLKECDCVFIGEILSGAQIIHCSNEKEKNRFLASVAHDAEIMRIKREIILSRIKESGVAYEH